jgi:hypothetical protein
MTRLAASRGFVDRVPKAADNHASLLRRRGPDIIQWGESYAVKLRMLVWCPWHLPGTKRGDDLIAGNLTSDADCVKHIAQKNRAAARTRG